SYNFFVLVVSDSIVVPDIFSPNGDGVNDEFRIFSTIDQTREDLIRIDEFSVYNRWGQRVFESENSSIRIRSSLVWSMVLKMRNSSYFTTEIAIPSNPFSPANGKMLCWLL
ncbi:MAG: gliding motility-associated C-terminal domain-containing protein, partial [Bacteroidota bacterium]